MTYSQTFSIKTDLTELTKKELFENITKTNTIYNDNEVQETI